ncbi:alanine racemase [Thalassobaculum fulvum]|uniref:Alanine racemase n=1 Tax=Thalassobaculum fulvum TaxID=1633335 RepID=A0A919CPZ5_9PROT|nr:alanine racemase [Thalassobaculum fulvum]GHD51626.1 alanine racemase [Thalassobaculum fulvum]
MLIKDLPTPHLVLDRRKLESNQARMRARAAELGVRLRPHGKTAKSAEVVRRAVGDGPLAVTVSTLREAHYFAENGIRDIVHANCIAPNRLPEAAALLRDGVDLAITIDSPDVAAEVVRVGRGQGVRFAVMLEVDVGEHRGGVAPGSEALLAAARILHEGGMEVRGVLAHAGHTYGCTDADAVAVIAEAERAGAVSAAERIRATGIPCREVSVGSTPGALFARHLEGVTEFRPGVYMFMDLFQAGVGCCGLDDIALSVLSSVINHRTTEGTAHIDAGGLALSKDRSTASQPTDRHFGLVTDVAGSPFPNLTVEAVHQEHGRLGGPGGVPFAVLPIGARVRVLPNHACMTAAMYERYAVVDGTELGEEQPVVEFWDRVNGW